MIPTFFGVSFAIWLVMTTAPGRPTSGAGGPGAGAGDGGAQEGDRAGTNVSERTFRQQFALNRPRFLNSWVGLEKDEIRDLIPQ